MKQSLPKPFAPVFWTLIALICVACASDNGVVGTPLEYTGAVTPAAITALNAEPLLLGAYNGGNDVNDLNVSPLSSGAAGSYRPGVGALIGIFSDIASSTSAEPTVSPQATGPTYTGNCGGSYSSTYTPAAASAWGTVTFVGYCEDGITLDGTMDFHLSVTSEGLTKQTMTFDSLQSNDGSLTVNLYGSFTTLVEPAAGETTLTVQVVYEDSVSMETRFASYTVSVVDGPDTTPADGTADYSDVSVSGRFYEHNEGYLIVSTDQPIRTLAGDGAPSTGVLRFVGAAGSWATYAITGIGTYSIDWFDGSSSGTINGP